MRGNIKCVHEFYCDHWEYDNLIQLHIAHTEVTQV